MRWLSDELKVSFFQVIGGAVAGWVIAVPMRQVGEKQGQGLTTARCFGPSGRS